MAEELKNKGNEAVAQGKFNDAIDYYTKALDMDIDNHVLYSNRSAAYARLGNAKAALKDAETAINLQPSWSKGYLRKGFALTSLKRYDEAYSTYTKGLEYEPENRSLLDAQEQIRSLISNQPMDIDPQSPLCNPKSPTVNAQNNSNGEINLSGNKSLAQKEKELGNAAYKKKEFGKAIEHYQKAIEYDSNDITFYNNMAAVYFEKQEYGKCIQECEKAVEIGRENRADFKLIAKAFVRIGNAYKKQNDYQLAKMYYEKAMSEHRTPETKTLLSNVEKIIKDNEKKAYINPEISAQEKELGNECFKKGDYSAAIKHYTEAIMRNPEDSKIYSNRAACYTKLGEFELGLKDCNKCIELDENFIKGYIRKGKILQGMQQSAKANQAYQKALEIDPNNAEALAGYKQCSVALHSDPKEVWKNAMSNPEVQQILKDPAMRLILDQMQNDPNAVKEHLKNPAIADKIYKLLESGIIQIH